MLILGWCPFLIQKEKGAGFQFSSMDYLGLALTPRQNLLLAVARQSASRKDTATFLDPFFQSGTGPKKCRMHGIVSFFFPVLD
jgi:hypothetical protein